MAFRLTFVIPGGISQCNPRQLLDEQTPALGGVRKTVPALIDRREYEAMDCLRTVSDVRVEEELISCADRDPSPARIEFEIGPAVEDHARCEFAIADAVGVLRQASGYGEAKGAATVHWLRGKLPEAAFAVCRRERAESSIR